jgi:3-hexulose-6-phosphate synthase
MKLQLALDQLTLSAAIQLIDELQDLIDIVEIGTPMIIAEGLSAVTAMKRRCPHLDVLADLKIVDGGAYESRIAFEAGADIVTVLGMAHDVTIEAAVGEATRAGRSIMVDLLGIGRVAGRVAGVEKLGVDYVCVHTAADLHGLDRSTLSRLKRAVAAARTAKTAVAGGIDRVTIDQIVGAGPDIVVVGGGIVDQADRRGAAELLKTRMLRTENH